MLLTKEEKEKILAVHKAESETRLALFKELEAASQNNNWEKYDEILRKLEDTIPDICEHGRSMCSPCLACDEIEAQLYDDLESPEERLWFEIMLKDEALKREIEPLSFDEAKNLLLLDREFPLVLIFKYLKEIKKSDD